MNELGRRLRVVRWRMGALLALLALATACGTNGNEIASPGPTVTGEATVNGATDQSDDWDQTVEAAKEEGRVVIYNVVPPEQQERITAAFNELYPEIELEITRGAGELIPRLESEISAGVEGADVFVFSNPAWFEENEEHIVELTTPNAAEWPEEGYAVPGKSPYVTIVPFGLLVWNTDEFPEGFTSFEDLEDPALEGRFATREDMTAAAAGLFEFLENNFGPDHFEALAELDPAFYASTVPLAQAIAAGEIGVTNVNVPPSIIALKEEGAPIDFHAPSDPGFAIQWSAGALEQASNPNAALVYLDFLMSREGQEAFNGDGYGATFLEDIPGAVNAEGFTFLESERFTPEYLEEWEEKFTDYFGR